MSLVHHHAADSLAVDALVGSRPRWIAVARARDVLELAPYTLLHAGPPIFDRTSLALPLKNSLLIAILFEGWAIDRQEAEKLLMSPTIKLCSAQDHGCAVPLADVLSPSMAVVVIEDAGDPSRLSFSTLNGGDGPVMRVGQFSDDVLQRLHWVNKHLAMQLQPVIARAPIDLLSVADNALAVGDDCHGRTQQGSNLIYEALLQRALPGQLDDETQRFLAHAPAFFLNLWMAAVKCCLLAAEDVPGSAVITAIGGNGSQFGIKISGIREQWFVVTAQPPLVPGADERVRLRSLGAIGDSAIVDAFGTGAMARDMAPLTAERLSIVCDEYEKGFPTTLLQHPHPQMLKAKAMRTGLDARQVCSVGSGPVISLGVLDVEGQQGRLDGGFYFSPIAPMRAALEALEICNAPE